MGFKQGMHTRVAYGLGIFVSIVFLFGSQSAYAASLYFNPSSGNVAVGNVLSVSVLVDTQGAAINAADAVIHFPPALLEVVSVSKSGSIFSLWIDEPAFSNNAGTIMFNGGLPTPGFTGTAGKLLNVVFRIRDSGVASLLFSTAAVRANDGYGTDVLQARNQAQFTLISEEKSNLPATPDAPVQEPQTGGAGYGVPLSGGLAITSPTHPDRNAWYAADTARFEWKLPEGADAVELLLDRDPASTPVVTHDSALTSREVANIGEGTYYFHARYRRGGEWSETGHYRVNIDLSRPTISGTRFDDERDSYDPQPVVFFDAKDNVSGLALYKVAIDGGEPISVEATSDSGQSYTLPLQKPGDHTILVKALDRAGNSAHVEESFFIQPLETPVLDTYDVSINAEGKAVVTGTALPNAKVVAFITPARVLPEGTRTSAASILKNLFRPRALEDTVIETLTDSEGRFTLTLGDLPVGKYLAQVKVVDKRGAESYLSEPIKIVVFGPTPLERGQIIVRYLSVIVTFLALFMFAGLIVFYGWFAVRRLRMKIEKEMANIDRDVGRVFELLQKDIEGHVQELKATKTKKDLIASEQKVMRTLRENLKEARTFLTREIADTKRALLPTLIPARRTRTSKKKVNGVKTSKQKK